MRAIFIDRDGTLNYDKGYTHKVEDLVILPGVIEGLKKLTELDGFKLFIVTNQSGISYGHFTEEDFWKFTNFLIAKLGEEGIHIEKIYFSPDIPEEPTEMRKPNIGMLKQAEKEYDIDLSKSYIIGDRSTDVEAGHRAGCKTVLIKSDVLKKHPMTKKPDALVNDMSEAADWIIKNEKNI